MQLSTTKYQSRVLMNWLSRREGAVDRAGVGVKAMLPENGSVANLNVDELARALGASALTAAGVPVTPETALRVSTVYGCVSLISGAVSTSPVTVNERTSQDRLGSGQPVEHDYWWMLNEQAWDEMTSSVAMEYFTSARLFYGDGFARLLRPHNFTNKVTGWQPWHPMRVEPFRTSQNDLRYRFTSRGGKVEVLDPSDVLHVPSMGFDGLRSPSPITYAAREAIGMSLAAEEFSARFFSQGSTHDIALTSKSKLSNDQLEALRKSYVAKYTGGRHAHVPLILSGGLTVEKLSITPEDAALIPSRQFTVEEICRILGVPPYMVGATDKTSSWGSGTEIQGRNFVKFVLERHLVPIAQEFNRKLWPNRERFFIAFDTSKIERGDLKAQMDAYRVAVGRAGEPGWMMPNEVRRALNMEPVTGGDTLYNGGNDGQGSASPPAGG